MYISQPSSLAEGIKLKMPWDISVRWLSEWCSGNGQTLTGNHVGNLISSKLLI